jgi:type I restriction enzyme M protein
MLDTQTKRRIDDCRDILVGKLPDPKAQIEQITIGLIYKFMDDMDKEAVELGGQAKFFSDYKVPDPEFPNDRKKDKVIEFSKYAWDMLMHPKVTANEMLTLYSEAIEGMEKNPNIPQLFRDIFNNAYLPYRDPETLKLFLKTIGEFEYTHSEKLGDAFEYLLSVMGSQGDAGQFRTPRHIIDFLVAIIDPDKTDTILDPACGTAGFLISAYKHILLKYSKDNKQGLNIYEYNKLEKKPFNNLGDKLTPDDRKKLIQNFVGYDISPDMVRLSLVNLYLHGFNTPNIHEYDTLSSEERWNENFDVVLANPPFMSPKGGIRPHKKFTISSNRSEVLFVDYIAEHLNPNGKAGIIVPEGIIFQSGTAYKDLRKMLVENHLYAVVSLPAGVFNPYSGVKTSILLMDKEVAKKRDEILFIKIDNDGYNLGAQRTVVQGGQLEEAIQLAHKFVETGEFEETDIAHLVPKAEIARKNEYYLSGESYKKRLEILSDFPIVNLSELVEIKTGKKDVNQGNPNGKYPFFTCAKEHTFSDDFSYDQEALLVAGNGDVGAIKYFKGKFEAYQRTYILSQFRNVLPKFLFFFLDVYLKEEVSKLKLGNTMPYIKLGMLLEFKVPLPPIQHQEEIVAEIEGYQKIIDGAKAVVTNYKPKIDIEPEWELVEFENAPFEIIDGDRGSNYPNGNDFSSDGYCLFLNTKNVRDNGFRFDEVMFISKEKDALLRKGKLKREDVVLTTRGTIGNTAYYNSNVPYDNIRINSGMLIFRPDNEKLLSEYLYYFFQSENCQSQFSRIVSGAAQPQLPIRSLKSAVIPIPSLEIQKIIVSKLALELSLVNANKQLLEIFEQKIKERISKVWGE